EGRERERRRHQHDEPDLRREMAEPRRRHLLGDGDRRQREAGDEIAGQEVHPVGSERAKQRPFARRRGPGRFRRALSLRHGVACPLWVASQFGALSWADAALAVAVAGAILGFAPFNRPVAKLFLGDVGSLPLGLLLFWLLVRLAANGHLAAALLLPLYYLADATVTLVRRLMRGDNVLRAHRTHFYQRATDHGFSVSEVVARVFVLNLVLAALAIGSVAASSPAISVAALAFGTALVGWLLAKFSNQRSGISDQGPKPDALPDR